MKTIEKHYIKEFFKILFIIALGLSLIFSLLDLIDKLDDFMPNKPLISQLAAYSLLNMPKYLYYLLPTALLICILFIFSQASRNKELVAVKAMGGRLKNIFRPFIFAGIMFSLVSFILGEFIVPDFSEKSRQIKSTLKKSEKKLVFQDGAIWVRGTDGSLVRMELYIPEDKYAVNVSIFLVGETYLRKRIEAQDARWVQNEKGGVWELKNVLIYDMEKGEVKQVPHMAYHYLESPDFFKEALKKPEEMGITELRKYIKKLENAGFEDRKLDVDLHSKISYPFTNFFMMLIGLSLSVGGKAGGGLFAAGLGLFISFVYWLMYTFSLSMGYAGIVPPAISTWLAPIMLGMTAYYFFRNIPE